jgi:hypothetical protein
MPIPPEYFAHILAIDVNEHYVDVNYAAYSGYEYFQQTPSELARLEEIEANLTTHFNRAGLVDLYTANVDARTKFLATMIWGHAAPAAGINQQAGQAHNAGPFRVSQMMSSLQQNPELLDDLAVDTPDVLQLAYAAQNQINRCGPNFFTKHLYFLGKSQGLDQYPVILDNRVALGLVYIHTEGAEVLNMVDVTARTNWLAFEAYLNFIHNESAVIGCDADQIEYFLFNVAAGN